MTIYVDFGKNTGQLFSGGNQGENPSAGQSLFIIPQSHSGQGFGNGKACSCSLTVLRL